MHQLYIDDEVDDAIYAAETGHLPKPGGTDNQDRRLLDLLLLTRRLQKGKDREVVAKLFGAL